MPDREAMNSAARRLRAGAATCRDCWGMVKPAHFIFVMPPALCGMLLAAGGAADWRILGLITLAMLGIWCAAMTYNRIVDRSMDSANPRTAGRALPAGRVSLRLAWAVCLCGAALFVAAAALLSPLCLALAPPALILALGYSHSKYHTRHCHFLLGLVVAVTPPAGALACGAEFTAGPLLLGLGLGFWVSGFDIIYACQDADFDRAYGIFSAPANLGTARALALSRTCHALSVAFLVLAGIAQGLGFIYFFSILGIAGILVYEQSLVGPGNLSRLRTAFLTCNSLVAVVLLFGVCLDIFWR